MTNRNKIRKNNKIINKIDKRREIKEQHNINTRKKLKEQKEKDEIFINLLCAYVSKKYPNFCKPHINRKFTLLTIIKEVFYFLKAGVSYAMYRGELKRSSLHYYVNYFAKRKIFSNFYWDLHKTYDNKNNADKNKFVYTDSSFILNQNCLLKYVERNKYMKNKNCIKISLVTDKIGIPIDIMFVKGNRHDSPLLTEHLANMKNKGKITAKKYKNSKRYKQYFMADAGYDIKKNIKELTKLGYIPIIPRNKRNNKKSIPEMSKNHKKLYKNRIKIENVFANLKQFKRISKIHEQNIQIYRELVHLALTKMLHNNL